MNTWADLVPSYSNAADLVNLLAPSNACVTTDLVGPAGYNPNVNGNYTDLVNQHSPFGGTSAACPYAAGAAAVLQAATLAVKGYRLTPAQVRDYLRWSGTLGWDQKGQVLTPRVQLDRAIEMAIGTWVQFGYSGTELGTVTEPFNSLSEAINAAPTGGLVNIQTGSTSETITITKAVTLQTWYGTATIGQ
jgi:subtilisin family serine protease